MGSTDYKFEGWMGLSPEAAQGKMVWQEFEPKPWEETDVDIKVTHCGVCGSDLHTMRAGWFVIEVALETRYANVLIGALPITPVVSGTKSSVPPFALAPKPLATSRSVIASALVRRVVPA